MSDEERKRCRCRLPLYTLPRGGVWGVVCSVCNLQSQRQTEEAEDQGEEEDDGRHLRSK